MNKRRNSLDSELARIRNFFSESLPYKLSFNNTDFEPRACGMYIQIYLISLPWGIHTERSTVIIKRHKTRMIGLASRPKVKIIITVNHRPEGVKKLKKKNLFGIMELVLFKIPMWLEEDGRLT